MDNLLAQEAVGFALSGNWKEALDINLKILKQQPQDVEALNRLARAYKELGQMTKARSTTQKVIKIDPANQIALKAIARWEALKEIDKTTQSGITADAFLEEPGKTKLVTLMHPGDKKVLAKLDSGNEVSLLVHPHRISVVTTEKKYIGRLPDDLAARLRRMIKAGNKYIVRIKSVNKNEIGVFIRETFAKETPSFLPEKIEYVSFTPPEFVHKEGGPLNLSEEEI